MSVPNDLTRIIQIMDQLDPQGKDLHERVKALCDKAGWEVTGEQVEQAMTVKPASAGEVLIPSISPKMAKARWWRKGLLAAALGMVNFEIPVFLGYGALMLVAKIGYGAAGLHLFSTYKFNNLLLMVAGLCAAFTLIAGTVGVARDGEMLGKQWASISIPIRMLALAALLLPIVGEPSGEHISAMASIWLSWLS